MSKFCEKCGTLLDENEKFCPNCGTRAQVKAATGASVAPDDQAQPFFTPDPPRSAPNTYHVPPVPVQQQAMVPKVKKKMSTGKKVKIILLTLLAMILVVVLALTAVFFLGGPYDVYRNIKDQNYYEARTEYSREVGDSAVKKLLLKTALGSSDTDVAEAFKAGTIDYPDAVQALEALEYVGLGDMTALIDELAAVNEVNTALANGNEYYENGDYENALLEYSKIDAGSEAYASIQDNVNTAMESYKSDALTRAQACIDSQDYQGALQILSTAAQVARDDADIAALYHSTASTYEQVCVQQATERFAAEQFDAAEDVLMQALQLLPDSQVLSDKLTEVQNTRPIDLLDTTALYGGRYYELVDPAESDGFSMGSDTYYEGFIIRDTGYALFDLKGAYTSISFTVGHINDSSIEDSEMKVYLNDQFVQAYSLSGQSVPQKITIPLNGAANLKIEMTEYGPDWGFANVVLYQ